MRLVYWAVLVFLVALTITDDAKGQELSVPLEVCTNLAEKYSENPYKMLVGELDTFRLCVVDLLVLKQR